jgi:two-component sensor histidine kinase
MTMASQPDVQATHRPFLYIAEYLHRVHNEYTCAISLSTWLAAKSSNEETKVALAQVIAQLRALARVHEIVRPPLMTGISDLNGNLAQLCSAMASSGLTERGIELHLATVKPVLLDAQRCWRAELIISELIANSARHAFASRGGRITVSIRTASAQVICRVIDDGSPTATLKRGLGTELIDALATDVDGYIERLHKASGTTVTVCFPRDLAERPRVSGSN